MEHAGSASFAELLRRYRLAAGLTQAQLATRAGLSEPAISTLERGTRQAPHRDTVRLLSDALKLDADQRAALTAAAAARPRAAIPAARPFPDRLATRPSYQGLPAMVTSLVGRERELAAVAALIAAGCRMVTLTGPGGVGKTRLAIEAAHAAHAHFPDGICFVDLAPLTSPALVPQAVAVALGLRDAPARSPVRAITGVLAGGTALLLLDNCEHLLDACAELITAILHGCPRIVVIATSRERLRLDGEQNYRLAPMPLPSADWAGVGANAGAALLEFAAVRLFVQCAQAAQREFTLRVENASAIAAICRRLDGLPLAIELAAARVRVLSPQQIAAGLDKRFSLLARAPREAPARQQTLRALIDWSYDLLGGAERALLRRLAVFAGGCTLEAAEAVCSDEPVAPLAVLDLLAALVDKSLVVAETGDVVARYHLIESVHAYALERLEASGEVESVRRRHAAYYLALAEIAYPELHRRDQIAWLERLEEEHNNLRTALVWLHEHGSAESALRLATALAPFWEGHGHLDEGRRWIERSLDLSAAASASPALRARTLIAGGRLAQWQSDLDDAAALLDSSLALARPLGDRAIEAEALVCLAAVRRRQGQFARSVELVEQSLALYRRLDDGAGIALALLNLGVVLRFQGETARSVPLLQESIERFRVLGDVRWMAIAQSMLGTSLLDLGDIEGAAGLIRAGLAGHRAVGDRTFLLFGLLDMAAVRAAQGQPMPAARLLGAVATLCTVLDAPLAPANVRHHQRLMRDVQQSLGDAAFAAAFAEGEALPLDAAVAIAETAAAPPRESPY